MYAGIYYHLHHKCKWRKKSNESSMQFPFAFDPDRKAESQSLEVASVQWQLRLSGRKNLSRLAVILEKSKFFVRVDEPPIRL
jgi:hypothetical protein